MRKVCIFTSTRAEWGLQKGVAELIRLSDGWKLQLLVSGSHLSENFGRTFQEIKADGFVVDEQVDILKYDDSPRGICRSMALALREYGESLERLSPDLLVILGDRYEAFCAAAVAQILRIPIAHIHGGETTEGAVDEAFRHSITKMAHLHFPCCEEYRRRIIQMGEDPKHVFNVGALGVENIRKISLMRREELEESIKFTLDRPFFLVTFHPVTLEHSTAGEQFDVLLTAFNKFPDHKVIITAANSDTDGSIVNEMIQNYAGLNPERCLAVSSLGACRYLSAMKFCDAVVGNSSSGILEAPAFNIPTVNIGDRQKGRVRAESIVDCDPELGSIVNAFQSALSLEFRKHIQNMVNPFDKKNTAMNIVKIIMDTKLDGVMKKSFFDLKGTYVSG